jgi:hypothetical protein
MRSSASSRLFHAVAFLALAFSGSDLGCAERAEPVDRFRELEIVDEAVVGDARARNDAAGAFSFRHLVVNLAGDEDDAADVVFDTLRRLGHDTEREVLCPWLRETSANGCDATCSTCETHRLDLSRAPLRLLAISNRLDLGDKPDATSPAGEVRFVYGVTRGPGDDPRSAPRAMTVIVEYALPDTRSPAGWATAWHALGSLEGTPYLEALEGIVHESTRTGALAQIRTNAAAGEPDPGMRELAMNAEGRFRPRALRNTPRPNLVASEALATFLRENEEAVRRDLHLLPEAMRADRVDARGASAPQVPLGAAPADVQRAFAAGTCNGCHGGSHPVVDDVFHVSPFRSGRTKLSRFLHDPEAPADDDLGRRERDLRRRLSALPAP